VLSSGQAVVPHRLAIMSNDGELLSNPADQLLLSRSARDLMEQACEDHPR
jgi:hypothetical protein